MIWPTWTFQRLFRYMQAWVAALQLHYFLDQMDVPDRRKDVTELHNILWLHRNLHINNLEHNLYEQSLRLMKFLLQSSLMLDLDRHPWEAHTWFEPS